MCEDEDVEGTFRLPIEGEPVVNFLLEELHEVPLEILVEVRLILPGEELPLDRDVEDNLKLPDEDVLEDPL